MDNALLDLICCPQTHQPLTLASGDVLTGLNTRIARGTVTTRGGEAVSSKLEAGLLREDGAVVYPITGGIPILLVDEGIPL